MAEKRGNTGFLIRQRAYIKLFILTKIGTKRVYGKEILDQLTEEFRPFNYKPYHSEVYRGLQELLEGGYIKRQRVKLKNESYQEIYLYYIHDVDKVNMYKKMVQEDLNRCMKMLKYALDYNFD